MKLMIYILSSFILLIIIAILLSVDGGNKDEGTPV